MAPQTPRHDRRANAHSHANSHAPGRPRARHFGDLGRGSGHKENSPAPSSIVEDESLVETEDELRDSPVVSPETPFTSPFASVSSVDQDVKRDTEDIEELHGSPLVSREVPTQEDADNEVGLHDDSLSSSAFSSPTISPVQSGDRRSTVTVQGLDRFLPRRTFDSNISDRLHANRPTTEMTMTEAVTRSSAASHDPFVSTPHQRRDAAIQRTHALAYTRELRQRQSDEQATRALGSIWDIGDVPPPINDSRAHLVQASPDATRRHTTSWPGPDPSEIEESDMYADRVAAALGLDRAGRILPVERSRPDTARERWGFESGSFADPSARTHWDGTQWVNDRVFTGTPSSYRKIPSAPFKILDAPNLRNDFYCSLLSWCDSRKILAVGLGGKIYAWTDKTDIVLLKDGYGEEYEPWIPEIAFSSDEGDKAILAWCCSDGDLGLMSMDDFERHGGRPNKVRFVQRFDARISCLSWRPKVSWRQSRNPLLRGQLVPNEDLLVGDEHGAVSYYAVEWPTRDEERVYGFHGSVTLIARVFVHSQQVCGLAWSPNGSLFASGGNDNVCSLFEAKYFARSGTEKLGVTHMLAHKAEELMDSRVISDDDNIVVHQIPRVPEPDEPTTHHIRMPRHTWVHAAAVKAIAFCPWRADIVATGGGSVDKCIHFFHTVTGKELAEIQVSAQVTSLVWSKKRREIVATFGFAIPEHCRRIAVFSWPECTEIASLS